MQGAYTPPIMLTQLIINADDFGFSRGITDGILRAHREGILTSTTLMTTMPDRDRAIDLAGQTPGLGVGIHLSLTQGMALTSCRRLLNRHGRFPRSLPQLFWKLRTRAARQEARDELLVQIQYAQGRGLVPTHVDSHKHVAHWPGLHGALIDACRASGVRWVRCAREAAIEGVRGPGAGYRVQMHFARQLAKRVAAAGLRTTDWFFGLATTGRTDTHVYTALAKHPPTGLGELMVHPGLIADLAARQTRLLTERMLELEALCDPRSRQALRDAGIDLTHYGDAD